MDLVNHIAFVVDRSGSMGRIKAQVVRVFNNQLDTVQRNAKSAGQNVKVKPGNHLNYSIFVESTSNNRKLVRGSTLLYQH
jgi:hypothetical protein